MSANGTASSDGLECVLCPVNTYASLSGAQSVACPAKTRTEVSDGLVDRAKLAMRRLHKLHVKTCGKNDAFWSQYTYIAPDESI